MKLLVAEVQHARDRAGATLLFGVLRPNHQVWIVVRIWRDVDDYVVDGPPCKRAAPLRIVGDDRLAGVLADVQKVIEREDAGHGLLDASIADRLPITQQRDLAALA